MKNREVEVRGLEFAICLTVANLDKVLRGKIKWKRVLFGLNYTILWVDPNPHNHSCIVQILPVGWSPNDNVNNLRIRFGVVKETDGDKWWEARSGEMTVEGEHISFDIIRECFVPTNLLREREVEEIMNEAAKRSIEEYFRAS